MLYPVSRVVDRQVRDKRASANTARRATTNRARNACNSRALSFFFSIIYTRRYLYTSLTMASDFSLTLFQSYIYTTTRKESEDILQGKLLKVIEHRPFLRHFFAR